MINTVQNSEGKGKIVRCIASAPTEEQVPHVTKWYANNDFIDHTKGMIKSNKMRIIQKARI